MQDSIYTPGAGHRPPVLAGRDELLRDWSLMINDLASRGRVRAADLILTGPRGVGKTAAMSAFGELCGEQGFEVLKLQPAGRRPSVVSALLQRAREGLDEQAGPWQRAKQAFERLSGANISVAGFGAGISLHDRDDAGASELDGGAVATALATLAREVRHERPGGGVLVTVDEVQAAADSDLSLLAAALHRLNVEHSDAVVAFAGTGLPSTLDVLIKAGVTHPDRLFDLRPIPLTLSPEDARYAIVEPARMHGVVWDADAASRVVQVSNGYPAHLQLFADEAWKIAPGPNQILAVDLDQAIPHATAAIERRSLGPRWDRMTERQMELITALALHGGTASTAALARTLGRARTDLSWVRDELLHEGDVYVPHRGELSLAVPTFGPYVLDHYEAARGDSTRELLGIAEMRANVSARTSGHEQSKRQPQSN
jgi:hypothetical protein